MLGFGQPDHRGDRARRRGEGKICQRLLAVDAEPHSTRLQRTGDRRRWRRHGFGRLRRWPRSRRHGLMGTPFHAARLQLLQRTGEARGERRFGLPAAGRVSAYWLDARFGGGGGASAAAVVPTASGLRRDWSDRARRRGWRRWLEVCDRPRRRRWRRRRDAWAAARLAAAVVASGWGAELEDQPRPTLRVAERDRPTVMDEDRRHSDPVDVNPGFTAVDGDPLAAVEVQHHQRRGWNRPSRRAGCRHRRSTPTVTSRPGGKAYLRGPNQTISGCAECCHRHIHPPCSPDF